MEILKDNTIDGQKVQIDYPTNWTYKLIGTSQDGIDEAIKTILGERKHTKAHSKNSKGGKYISINLDTIVDDEDDRNKLFSEFKKDTNIKMVL